MSIAPRVRRLRDRCLCVLAVRRGLPAPNAAYLATTDDSLSLNEILDRWAKQQAANTGVALDTSPAVSVRHQWWKRPSIVRVALGIAFTGLVVVIGVRWPSLIVRRAAASDAARWTPLTDSVAAADREKLLDLSEISDAPLTMSIVLSAGDLAALVLDRPDRWRWAAHAGVAARIDSVLWLRGTAPDGRRFSLAGTVRRARARRGELRLVGLWVDSVAVASGAAPATLRGLGLFGTEPAGIIRFELPRYVMDVQLRGRTATAVVGRMARDGRR